MLESKQGLIAGDGSLPVKMAQYAQKNGFEVIREVEIEEGTILVAEKRL